MAAKNENLNNNSSSSFSQINGADEEVNSYNSLCEESVETCDFCDKVFKNRYSSIIHNATHIIIPLLKQNIFKCGECLHDFTSQYKLNQHIAVKHIITEFVPKIVLVKNDPTIIEISDSEGDSDKNCGDESDSKKYINGNVKESSQRYLNNKDFGDSKQSGVDIKRDIQDEVDIQRDIQDEVDIQRDIQDEVDIQRDIEDEIDSDSIDIKSRLVFEDDDLTIIENNLISDLTKECKVGVENSPWLKLPEDNGSIHFDQLMVPGLYRCKKCARSFPNRYQSILHETKHISLARTQIQFCKLCMKYIQGYMTHHMMKVHPYKLDNMLAVCKKCGMKYTNIESHNKECLGWDGTYKERSSIVRLCDMCYTFCRNTQSRLYSSVGTMSTVGKVRTCHMCKNRFLHLNLVRRTMRVKEECTKNNAKKKIVSYAERLKNIQKRLKTMKKCFVFSFFMLCPALSI